MWRASTYTPSYSPLGPSTPIGFWGFNPVTGYALRANYDQSIRSNLLHHFGFGYTASNPIRQRDSRRGNEIYKVPGVAADSPGFPVFNVNNTYGNLALGNSDQQPNDPSQNRNYRLRRQYHLDQRPSPVENRPRYPILPVRQFRWNGQRRVER